MDGKRYFSLVIIDYFCSINMEKKERYDTLFSLRRSFGGQM